MTREFTEDEVVALAQRAYRLGVAQFRLLPDRAALLVIDMQDEFVRPGWTPYWIPEATRQVPRLATILRNVGRDTVIISGTLTNLCCGTTARQAYERGFQVVVGSDVTATNDPAVHEHELMTLRYGFARVLTTDEIVQAFAMGD